MSHKNSNNKNRNNGNNSNNSNNNSIINGDNAWPIDIPNLKISNSDDRRNLSWTKKPSLITEFEDDLKPRSVAAPVPALPPPLPAPVSRPLPGMATYGVVPSMAAYSLGPRFAPPPRGLPLPFMSPGQATVQSRLGYRGGKSRKQKNKHRRRHTSKQK